MRLEELLHCVGVPFVDIQSLLDVAVLVQELHCRVQATHVLDVQVGELGRSVTLYERLDLGIRTEFTGADLENGLGVPAVACGCLIPLAALLAVWPDDQGKIRVVVRRKVETGIIQEHLL